jgi:hypothetical protein
MAIYMISGTPEGLYTLPLWALRLYRNFSGDIKIIC